MMTYRDGGLQLLPVVATGFAALLNACLEGCGGIGCRAAVLGGLLFLLVRLSKLGSRHDVDTAAG